MTRFITALVLLLGTMVPSATPQEQPVATYAFIAPVIATNTGTYRNQVRQLATGLRDKLVGIDENGQVTTNPELAIRFVLGLSGVALSPQIDAHIYVGWHPNVADNVRDRFFDLQYAGLYQTPFFPPPDPITEQWMIDRMMQRAQEQGAARYWLMRPGDNITTNTEADLLAKFLLF